MLKIHFVPAILVLLIAPSFSQEAPALGDIARRLRAEKTDNPAAPEIAPAKLGSSVEPAVRDTADPAAVAGQKEINDYIANVRALLNQEKFDELDRVAATARSSKARFPGGGWKLSSFYSQISNGPQDKEASDAEWIANLEQLKRWISLKPESITPRVALADAYLSYAWKARGNEYADKVTEDGWKLFQERSQTARDTLEKASALKEKCPQWYRVMQEVAIAQGWKTTEAAALLEKAIVFEPGYYYYYQAYARFLLPKWYGEEGDSEAFADAIATRLGGKLGEITYYKVARDMLCDCSDQTSAQRLSWPRIRQGYAANEHEYGASTYELNAMAHMSIKFADVDTANKFFTRIDEQWDESVWHSKKYFDDCKSWVREEMTERKAAIDHIESMVKANLEKPEGQAYDLAVGKEFGQNFASAMNDCVKAAGDDLQNFTLYLQLSKDGKVGAIVPMPVTAVDACLAPKVYATTFSSPPAPAYWVRISMNIKP